MASASKIVRPSSKIYLPAYLSVCHKSAFPLLETWLVQNNIFVSHFFVKAYTCVKLKINKMGNHEFG